MIYTKKEIHLLIKALQRIIDDRELNDIGIEMKERIFKWCHSKKRWEDEEKFLYNWIENTDINKTILTLIELLKSSNDKNYQDIVTDLIGRIVTFAVKKMDLDILFSNIFLLKAEFILDIFLTIFEEMKRAKYCEHFYYNLKSFSKKNILDLFLEYLKFKDLFTLEKNESFMEVEEFAKILKELYEID